MLPIFKVSCELLRELRLFYKMFTLDYTDGILNSSDVLFRKVGYDFLYGKAFRTLYSPLFWIKVEGSCIFTSILDRGRFTSVFFWVPLCSCFGDLRTLSTLASRKRLACCPSDWNVSKLIPYMVLSISVLSSSLDIDVLYLGHSVEGKYLLVSYYWFSSPNAPFYLD